MPRYLEPIGPPETGDNHLTISDFLDTIVTRTAIDHFIFAAVWLALGAGHAEVV